MKNYSVTSRFAEKLAQAIFQNYFGGRARGGLQLALEVLDTNRMRGLRMLHLN